MQNQERILTVLREIEEQVEKGDYFPIIGPLKGELLYCITLLKRPVKVLELGTGIGYSGLHIARALEPGAKVVTVDRDEENSRRALKNFRRAGVEDMFYVVVDEAGRYLQREEDMYDMIFLDIDKPRYLELLERLLHLLRPHGILVADNVLRPELRRFRQAILTHPQLASSIIELEDGVSVSVKRD